MKSSATSLLLHATALLVLSVGTVNGASDSTDAEVFQDTRAVDLSQGDSGNLYVRATLDDAVTDKFMVDTGSGYVVLTTATFRSLSRLSPLQAVDHVVAALANGRRIKTKVYRIEQLTLEGGCTVRDVEAVVLRGSDRNIIGMNALKGFAPLTLSIDPPQLGIGACEGSGRLLTGLSNP